MPDPIDWQARALAAEMALEKARSAGLSAVDYSDYMETVDPILHKSIDLTAARDLIEKAEALDWLIEKANDPAIDPRDFVRSISKLHPLAALQAARRKS